MYTVEFQISLCCLWVVFVDWKLQAFTLAFLQCFWAIRAASWPHFSQWFYCLTLQVGSSMQRGFGQAGSGRVLSPKSRQLQPRAGVTSSAEVEQQPFLGLSHSYSLPKQFCFAPRLLACYLCSTPFSFLFYHLCENAEGMSVHISS